MNKIELTSLGLIKLTGNGAKKLLQGQLTCDLEKLTKENNHTLGAYCNPQGRVVSLFRVILIEDHYYLMLPRIMIPLTLTALKKFAPFYTVTLEDVSESWRLVGVIGEQSNADHEPETIILEIPGPVSRFIGLNPHPLQHTAPLNENEWKRLDIQAGYVTLFPETSGKYLAHELGLHKLGAISFDKGCYSGQEIISRMQYLGKLKNHLHRGLLKGNIPYRGEDIYQSTTIVGSIVDYCEIDYNTYDILFIAQKQTVKDPLCLGALTTNEIQQVISLFE